jgi:hypothetical protein
VIKWLFGVVKRCFKALVVAQEYSLNFQSRLISALDVLHNFILIHDPDNLPTDIKTQDNALDNADNARSRAQGVVSNAK